MKDIAIFGSTGSIGTSTLNVVRRHPEEFKVKTLVAGRNIKLFMEQVKEFSPAHVYISDEKNADILKEAFPGLDIYFGDDGMDAISSLTDFDTAVSALVGIAGLAPTYNMVKNGKTVALANKEVLVTGGSLVTDAAKKYGAEIVTVDSEHSAILQCLRAGEHGEIEKVILTASGGPFFDKPITSDITPEQALNHPTWKMGPKITIDSSTMMNKGFEVLEAKWLFDVEPDQIQVAIHRQSIVHSMVEFRDGSIIANIAPPDMELPIAYALAYPRRLDMPQRLDIFSMKALEFCKPDLEKFKCLNAAIEVSKMPQSAAVALNGANEVLVDAFLNKKVRFTDIPDGVCEMVERHDATELASVDEVLQADREIRAKTGEYIKSLAL